MMVCYLLVKHLNQASWIGCLSFFMQWSTPYFKTSFAQLGCLLVLKAFETIMLYFAVVAAFSICCWSTKKNDNSSPE
jgi:hypothetical protein